MGVRSAERTLSVLDLLAAAAPDPIRVCDVAGELEITAASASRLLATLAARGYASRTPDRRYTLGPRSIDLATGWIVPLRRALTPGVARIAQETGEAVVVAQLLGDRVVPLVLTGPPRHPVYVRAADHPEWPVASTAVGRALLTALPPGHRRRLLGASARPESWERERFRGDGGALFVDRGDTLDEVGCIAVPLACRGGHVVALGVMADRNRPNAPRYDRMRRCLRSEADRLGAGMLG